MKRVMGRGPGKSLLGGGAQIKTAAPGARPCGWLAGKSALPSQAKKTSLEEIRKKNLIIEQRVVTARRTVGLLQKRKLSPVPRAAV